MCDFLHPVLWARLIAQAICFVVGLEHCEQGRHDAATESLCCSAVVLNNADRILIRRASETSTGLSTVLVLSVSRRL